jgi:ATP-binding cassette subfamily G (WHITE) protein 2
MKSPISESPASKKERVDRVIKAIALESCRKTVIGNVMHRGISGGQAKRANIGLALVTNPRVLMLDEPTSGLVGGKRPSRFLQSPRQH